MSGRIGRLFRRYAAHHLRLEIAGPELAAGGARLGRVERIALVADRLVVEGHARAERVALRLERRSTSAVPGPRRDGRPGFRLDLPYAPGPAVLELTAAARLVPQALPGLPAWRLAAARLALVPGFAFRTLRALPAVLRWLRHRDPQARHEVRRILDLGLEERPRPLGAEVFQFPDTTPGATPDTTPAAPPAVPALPGPVTVVLPVHDAFDLLAECLDRLERHSDLPWRLIAIDDASPDPRIAPLLRDFAARHPAGRVEILGNRRNLGFVGTANRGLARAMEAAPAAPVVLLNSDALVPAGWLSRLLAPMQADPESVASVTPMSNDAELVSVPVICARTDLRPGEAAAIDAAAARLAPGAGLAEAPAGVGFCMALNPRFLAQIPLFDTVFGRGYGEEVDWCQKVAARGGRHLCQPRLFVEHRGGASFGSEEKRRLLQRNGEIVSARHPRFDAEVQQFLAEDPLLAPRLVLALAFAAARAEGGPVPVYLAHAIGGGAEHWLAERLAADTAAGGAAAVLRVGGPVRWRIELHSAAGTTWGETPDTALMHRFLGQLPARRVVYSCGVGDPDPMALPGVLLDLASGPRDRLEVLFHDYFPISPSYTLLGAGGRWRGLPDPATADRAHLQRRPDGSRPGLAAWQAEWGRLMARADRITTFSGASRALVEAVWPGLRPRIETLPHPLRHAVPRLAPAPAGGRPVIGVLGNIGPHKGAEVLVRLSARLARGGGAGLVLVGNLDPAYRLVPPARVHGSYRLEDLPELVRRYRIGCWFIPSVWPETFSYATHEALATGLPVWCFDLGAQAEAVAAAAARGGGGGVIPLAGAQADPGRILDAILGGGKAMAA